MSGHGTVVGARRFTSAFSAMENRIAHFQRRVLSAAELTTQYRHSGLPFSPEVLDEAVADLHEVEMQAHELAGSGVTL